MPVQKTCLVSCGALAELYYAPALLELQKRGVAEVAGLFDTNPGRIEVLGRSFPGARTFGNYEQMLGAFPKSLLIVSSPPKFHAEQTVRGLEGGHPVLCEKPMAVNSSEAAAMIAAAKAGQAPLAVGLFRRFMPACEWIRETMAALPFGRLRSFDIAEGGPFNWPAKSDSFFRKEQTPGGVFFDIGIHVLDLLLWWRGEPASVDYRDDAMGGLEANCELTLAYQDGCQGKVRLSRDTAIHNHYLFEFENASVTWETGKANGLSILAKGSSRWLAASLHEADRTEGFGHPGALANDTHQSFVRQILNLIDAAQGRGQVRIDGEEGAKALRWVERCYQQRRLMEMGWLTPAEQARANSMAGVAA